MPYYEKHNAILDANLFSTFYALELSANRRFHAVFTLVFISIPPSIAEEWEVHLQKCIRDTDIAFRFPAPHPYQILLSNAQQHDAQIFVTRIFKKWEESGKDLKEMYASILSISSGSATLEDVIREGRKSLKNYALSEKTLPYITNDKFSIRERTLIKVSILEEDPLVTRVLSNILERSVIKEVDIDLRVFHDGNEFLESDWYQSPHTHVVILNDILPKKTGLEVLHALRAMPNERKFYIFMMTKRLSEEETIYAYLHGVDEYITKPFNPKLFEAQVKKVLGRLYI